MTAVLACSACGIEPLENARFCHGCGSPVAVADTHAEYKQVTVLFADVVHSMDIAAAVGVGGSRAAGLPGHSGYPGGIHATGGRGR